VTETDDRRIGNPAAGWISRQCGQKGYSMPKHRRKMSWDDAEKLVRLLVGAIAPVADLIRAISRLR
jgi:hypothetical protein